MCIKLSNLLLSLAHLLYFSTIVIEKVEDDNDRSIWGRNDPPIPVGGTFRPSVSILVQLPPQYEELLCPCLEFEAYNSLLVKIVDNLIKEVASLCAISFDGVHLPTCYHKSDITR